MASELLFYRFSPGCSIVGTLLFAVCKPRDFAWLVGFGIFAFAILYIVSYCLWVLDWLLRRYCQSTIFHGFQMPKEFPIPFRKFRLVEAEQ